MFSDEKYSWFAAAAGGKKGLLYLDYCAGFCGRQLQVGLYNMQHLITFLAKHFWKI
jgi:hypothetical protein